MGKGGKYLSKKAPVAKKKKSKVLPVILLSLLVILVGCIGFGIWYYNHLLSMITRPDEFTMPTTESSAMVTEAVQTQETEPEETTQGTTSPEDTWPEIVSDENITNIMLVGQASREGEAGLIADTMILVSINRETKTLTLTSLMRDMRLVWPQYTDTNGKTHTGNNRINMAYNMGYHWTGNKQDSMDLLESIVQHNFGIPVERTVEIDFGIFMKISDLIGGVTVDFTEEEIKYMQDNYGDHEPNWILEPGENHINGWQALCYARMRKVGHGDYERTERQREVIMDMLKTITKMNLMEIHSIFTQILPEITTDLTNKEITNLFFELIPMLKNLEIQSQRIPFDGNEMSVPVEIDGVMDYQIAPRDLKATARQLQESIGMTVTEE